MCRTSFLLAFCLSRLPPLTGGTFCALTVNIANYDGQPSRLAWVELIDPGGKVARKEMVRGPVLQICDFGFGDYSVRVFPNECHPVTISHLRLRLGHPASLEVRRMSCEVGEEEPTGCHVFLRLLNRNGVKLPNVRLASEGHDWPERTDECGRIAADLSAGEQRLKFSIDGYADRTVSLTCKEGADIEQEIVLTEKSSR